MIGRVLRKARPAGPKVASPAATPDPERPPAAKKSGGPGRSSSRRLPLPPAGKGLLGVELTRDGLRYVELRRSGRGVILKNHGERERDPSAELGSVLATILRDTGIEARDVHIVDSLSRANLKIQSMPNMPDKDLDLILRGEIAAEGELLGEEMVGDWCRLRTGKEETDVLIGKIPLGERQAIQAACEQAGLRLRVLTTSSTILARHLQLAGEVPAGETVVLLDTGRAKTNMALVSPDAIEVVREVYQGVSGSFLTAGEPEDGPESDLDAITAGLDEIVGTVAQIRRTWEQFREAKKDAVMHHVVMTGETTRIASLIGMVQHDLRVPVVTYDPSTHLSVTELPAEYAESAAAFAVPWVLASTPSSGVALNFAEPIVDRRPVRAALMVAAGAAAGCVAVGAMQFLQSAAEERAAEELARAEGERAAVEVELGILEDVRQEWGRFLGTQTRRGGLPSADPRPHLAETIRALPEEIRLTRIAFRGAGPDLGLEADARAVTRSAAQSHAAMEKFVAALDGSPLVRSIAMRPIQYQHDRSLAKEVGLEFSVNAQIRPVSLPAAPAVLPAPAADPADAGTEAP